MSKQSGLGDALLVAGVDLSGDIGALGNVHGGPALMDVTGIDKAGIERICGLFESGIDYSAWFNPTGAHPELAALPTESQVITYCRGRQLGSPAASVVAKQIDYPGKRGNDGALGFDVSSQGSDGTPLEWGVLATPGIRTDATATNGAGIDGGAASAFGLTAYVHLLDFAGTSVTIKLQDSADGATFADIPGATFGALSAVGATRIETATNAAVRRHVRVVTTGTFTAATFAVAFVRREAAK